MGSIYTRMPRWKCDTNSSLRVGREKAWVQGKCSQWKIQFYCWGVAARTGWISDQNRNCVNIVLKLKLSLARVPECHWVVHQHVKSGDQNGIHILWFKPPSPTLLRWPFGGGSRCWGGVHCLPQRTISTSQGSQAGTPLLSKACSWGR